MRIDAKKILSLECLLLFAMWGHGQTVPSSIRPVKGRQANLVEGYGRLPLAFEANKGQTDSQVKFLSRGAGYSLFLTPAEAVLMLGPSAVSNGHSNSAVLRMRLSGANPRTTVSGQDKLPGKSNYFMGSDPQKWHTSVPQYAKVRYAGIYPGVDLVYYGNQRELEYDFLVQPGANPKQIRLQIEGARRLHLKQGDLILTSTEGDVCLRSPHVYQEVNGIRRDVRGHYAITGTNEVGFHVSDYDRKRALIIDPVLAYSTFLGGNLGDAAAKIAVDAAGNAYVTGTTVSTDFPTVNAIQSSYGGGDGDVFVTKINSEGTALVYSTYLGGTAADYAGGIAVDAAGNAYVSGRTLSTDFPTFNAFQPTNRGVNDAFVTKIDASGALIYSTYLGGTGSDDEATGIAADSAGNAYVTGVTNSSDFPVLHPIQPTNHGGDADIFITKFNASGSALVYSTYLGGSDLDVGRSIVVDAAGNAYVGGNTWSNDFPTVNAIQPTYHGNSDAIVVKINAAGTALDYSTYLGGSNFELGWDVAVDQAGNAYATGTTASTDFPTANAIQPALRGSSDAFVTKINSSGSALVYSTYLAGSAGAAGVGIAADSAGSAYVTGPTNSTDFPVVNAIQPINGGFVDAFVTKFTPNGGAIDFSTYLGGLNEDQAVAIAVDGAGSAYITGFTNSKKFPATLLAFQQSLKKNKAFPSAADAFITKIAWQTSVSLSGHILGFGKHVVGTTSKQKRVTLTNVGTGVLAINQIYVAGANAGDFAQTNNCDGTLAPGASCKITVTFTPRALGMRKAVLGVSDVDAASPQAVKLTGVGT